MNHDFKNNYYAAEGANDNRMKRDMLFSEIAKQIVNNPERVLSNLSKSGFNVPKKASPERLAAMSSAALNRSRKFATLLTKDILISNMSFSADADNEWENLFGRGGGGTDSKTDSKFDFFKTLGQVQGIVQGLGISFGGKGQADATTDRARADAARAQAQANQALLAQIGGMKTMTTAKTNIGLYIGIGVGVVVVLAGGLILYKKFG